MLVWRVERSALQSTYDPPPDPGRYPGSRLIGEEFQEEGRNCYLPLPGGDRTRSCRVRALPLRVALLCMDECLGADSAISLTMGTTLERRNTATAQDGNVFHGHHSR